MLADHVAEPWSEITVSFEIAFQPPSGFGFDAQCTKTDGSTVKNIPKLFDMPGELNTLLDSIAEITRSGDLFAPWNIFKFTVKSSGEFSADFVYDQAIATDAQETLDSMTEEERTACGQVAA